MKVFEFYKILSKFFEATAKLKKQQNKNIKLYH